MIEIANPLRVILKKEIFLDKIFQIIEVANKITGQTQTVSQCLDSIVNPKITCIFIIIITEITKEKIISLFPWKKEENFLER